MIINERLIMSIQNTLQINWSCNRDEEIIAVLSYIKSTWPSKIKKIHDQINSRASKN